MAALTPSHRNDVARIDEGAMLKENKPMIETR